MPQQANTGEHDGCGACLALDYRLGHLIPGVLTYADGVQSRCILGVAKRCLRKLGYVPYRELERISDIENRCHPVPEAGQPTHLTRLPPRGWGLGPAYVGIPPVCHAELAKHLFTLELLISS
jgi:hypothetical protein